MPKTLAGKATKQELAGDFNQAFNSYVQAAQLYVYLIRHAPDSATKERLRTLSGKLVERATRIKQAKRLRPVQRDRLSIGVSSVLPPKTQAHPPTEEQDSVLERSSLVGGLRLPRWTAQDELEQPNRCVRSQEADRNS